MELQIDVHYSLPRDDNLAKGGEKNQVWKSLVSLTPVLTACVRRSCKELCS
jgi:hypothetical protein